MASTPRPPVRRVVTGHDGDGRAVIAVDGASPSIAIESVPGTVFHELWSTSSMPAEIDNSPDPAVGPAAARAPCWGHPHPDRRHSAWNTVQNAIAPEAAAAAFDVIGAHACRHARRARYAAMHRTETVDYGILLSGEIWLVVDDGEARLLPGDVVVQRGRNHAWSNRTDDTARMAFALVDGRFADELRRPTEGDA